MSAATIRKSYLLSNAERLIILVALSHYMDTDTGPYSTDEQKAEAQAAAERLT